MPEINPDTVPGSVMLPVWLIAVAFAGMGATIVWLIKGRIGDIEKLLTAVAANTAAIVALTTEIRSRSREP